MNNTNTDRDDFMPPEVATSMLASPRAKLSNRMRKECRAARASYYAVPQAGPTIEAQVAKRAKGLGLRQIVQRIRRLFKRERHYLNEADRSAVVSHQMRFVLRAAECRQAADALTAEMNLRKAIKCPTIV